MAADKATANSMGVVNIATGSSTGDGTALDVTLGFIPRHVRVFNLTDVILWEKFEAMPASNSVKQVTAGTTTLDTTSAIVIKGAATADGYAGFQMSAGANANAKVLHWVAFG